MQGEPRRDVSGRRSQTEAQLESPHETLGRGSSSLNAYRASYRRLVAELRGKGKTDELSRASAARRLTRRETSVAAAAAVAVGGFDEEVDKGDFVRAASWA